ncbi:MAG: antibiotic biosynthesis monooxygenase [Porticoccaceae bacterium]
MFIAMNRFRIAPGREQEFIDLWASRDSYLEGVPGFRQFNLVRGPASEEYSLFASHSVWDSRKSFEDWTHSEAFRKAHAQAGGSKGLYLGPPQLELFDAVI